MLIDNIKLTIRGGDGGHGAATLRRDGQTAKGGPDGGDGGRGGSIYFQGSHNLTDLHKFRYKKKVVAENGTKGARYNMFGKGAEDVTVYVPIGTRITDVESNAVTEITDTESRYLYARGGKGGRGNTAFKSATNQTPRTAELGEPGQERSLFLRLSLIADIGLIGLPNAGKSSLLTVLTHATPKIGAYPFTTLDPTIGMLGPHPIADIPGLIEGASEGRGLGIKFLRHIEKTKILLHCIDVTGEDLEHAYETIRREFEQFDPLLLAKPEYILLTKTDLVDPKKVNIALKLFTKAGKKVLTCSIYESKSIDLLKKFLVSLLQK